MKRAILVAMGFLPMIPGFIINRQMMTEWTRQIPTGMLTRVGLAILLMWFAIGWMSDRLVKSRGEALLFLNVGAALSLVSYLIHDLVIGNFFTGILGLLTQWFYLPMFFLTAHSLSVLSIGGASEIAAASFALLVMVGCLGSKLSPSFRGTSLLSK